jgi:hypothetical protein
MGEGSLFGILKGQIINRTGGDIWVISSGVVHVLHNGYATDPEIDTDGFKAKKTEKRWIKILDPAMTVTVKKETKKGGGGKLKHDAMWPYYQDVNESVWGPIRYDDAPWGSPAPSEAEMRPPIPDVE